jgi:hypothetical protein
LENRNAIFSLIRGSFTNWRGSTAEGVRLEFDAGVGREPTAMSSLIGVWSSGIREVNMKRVLGIAVVTLGLVFAQTGGEKGPRPGNTVTVTGCIYQGVECLILKNLKGKQDYSIARSNNLQVGHSYRITGPVGDIGFCTEGKPILGAQMVHELRLRCEPPTERK